MSKNHPLIRKRMGLREIAWELNKKGVPTTRCGKWYAGTIKYMLENPLYKGTVLIRKIMLKIKI